MDQMEGRVQQSDQRHIATDELLCYCHNYFIRLGRHCGGYKRKVGNVSNLYRVCLAQCFILIATVASAEPFYSTVEICDAIFMAEGGTKADYFYGIRSVPYRDISEAQQICFNTVRNNRKRWKNAGSKGEFIDFLASKYCPSDKIIWAKNVRWFIKHKNTKGR